MSNVHMYSDMAALRSRLGAVRPDTGNVSGFPSGEGSTGTVSNRGGDILYVWRVLFFLKMMIENELGVILFEASTADWYDDKKDWARMYKQAFSILYIRMKTQESLIFVNLYAFVSPLFCILHATSRPSNMPYF